MDTFFPYRVTLIINSVQSISFFAHFMDAIDFVRSQVPSNYEIHYNIDFISDTSLNPLVKGKLFIPDL